MSGAKLKKLKLELEQSLLENDHFIYRNSESLQKKINTLTFQERAELLICYRLPLGWVLSDPGGVFESRVRIIERYRKSGNTIEEENHRPLACIIFTDGMSAQVEVIDILESVRNDATAIGHPVITYAVYHWQKLLAWSKYTKPASLKRKSVTGAVIGDFAATRSLKSAKRNLEAIGKALQEGSRRMAIPKESALEIKIERLHLDTDNTYLRVAWERLENRYVNPTHELDERISEIAKFLLQLEKDFYFNRSELSSELSPEVRKYGYLRSEISIGRVLDFLKSAGSSFVYSEHNFHSQRGQWRVFKNAFAKWYFELESFNDYRNSAKRQVVEGLPYTPGVFGNSPITHLYPLFQKVITSPLERYCQPIKCDYDDALSHRIIDLINKEMNS